RPRAPAPASVGRFDGIGPRPRGSRRPNEALAYLVVGRFLRDGHVVGVALAEARRADPHEERVRPQLLDVAGAAVAHPGAQAPDHLEHRGGERSLERDPPLDPLRDEPGELPGVVLEATLRAAAGP